MKICLTSIAVTLFQKCSAYPVIFHYPYVGVLPTYFTTHMWASLIAQLVKNLPAVHETLI